MRKRFDLWSIVVIALTLVLFIVALFLKGLTHDLLLEAGVFLVSVKLIMMSHKSSVIARGDRAPPGTDRLCCATCRTRPRLIFRFFVLPAAADGGKPATTGRHK